VSPAVRPYRHPDDYDLVDRFLIEIHQPGDLVAWLEPRWEYMHGHPLVENVVLESIGIAEQDDRVVGVVNPEHTQAVGHLQIRPGHDRTAAPVLIDWALERLGGPSSSLGSDGVGLYADDRASVVRDALARRGFTPTEFGESHSRISLLHPVAVPSLPDGFRLQSLADENDLTKLNRVLWRGFDHDGEPPAEEIPGRERVQRTPNYRHDLNVVAVGPTGDYAAYAGIWMVPESDVAMVEPVATDPDHRRRGLGRAVVLEALRRAQERGARLAWVGSDLAFYRDMGFVVATHATLWWHAR
jgi:predicted N-acetyltransferase YhbS